MDEMAALQEALRNLREDVAAAERRTMDAINRHADDDIRRFELADRELNARFDSVTKAIESINRNLNQWTGSLQLLKWMGAICLPVIAGSAVMLLIRHWN